MGYFKTEIHTDENGDRWEIYHPTVSKIGSFYVKGKDELPPKKLCNMAEDPRILIKQDCKRLTELLDELEEILKDEKSGRVERLVKIRDELSQIGIRMRCFLDLKDTDNIVG